MLEPDDRDLPPPKPFKGEHPAMASEEIVIAIDQHRNIEAKAPNAAGYLFNLPIAVQPRIAGIKFEPLDRQPLDLEVSSSILRHLILLAERPRRARVGRRTRRPSASRLARHSRLLGARKRGLHTCSHRLLQSPPHQ